MRGARDGGRQAGRTGTKSHVWIRTANCSSGSPHARWVQPWPDRWSTPGAGGSTSTTCAVACQRGVVRQGVPGAQCEPADPVAENSCPMRGVSGHHRYLLAARDEVREDSRDPPPLDVPHEPLGARPRGRPPPRGRVGGFQSSVDGRRFPWAGVAVTGDPTVESPLDLLVQAVLEGRLADQVDASWHGSVGVAEDQAGLGRPVPVVALQAHEAWTGSSGSAGSRVPAPNSTHRDRAPPALRAERIVTALPIGRGSSSRAAGRAGSRPGCPCRTGPAARAPPRGWA